MTWPSTLPTILPLLILTPSETSPFIQISFNFSLIWKLTGHHCKIKCNLNRFFIDWMTQNAVSLTGTLTIFLGGGHKTDPKRCLVICNGNIKEEALLQCNLEEADDRMLFHVSHMVSSEAKRVVICSTDTDVFVNALYHFHDTWQKKWFTRIMDCIRCWEKFTIYSITFVH